MADVPVVAEKREYKCCVCGHSFLSRSSRHRHAVKMHEGEFRIRRRKRDAPSDGNEEYAWNGDDDLTSGDELVGDDLQGEEIQVDESLGDESHGERSLGDGLHGDAVRICLCWYWELAIQSDTLN
jgi:hypothetical protein